ncbi:hypothetical protein BpHYR1_041708 [Brachionus plicatilis]|uniref:Uncharacterized protein n=1 Tax=Brachionus plicatilis TaxID=10195 RepID=A0A3M7Q7K1_BRAPC|nr:hypothetical protein BpHYR1_041708 [Brachionus plicatilis]
MACNCKISNCSEFNCSCKLKKKPCTLQCGCKGDEKYCARKKKSHKKTAASKKKKADTDSSSENESIATSSRLIVRETTVVREFKCEDNEGKLKRKNEERPSIKNAKRKK